MPKSSFFLNNLGDPLASLEPVNRFLFSLNSRKIVAINGITHKIVMTYANFV